MMKCNAMFSQVILVKEISHLCHNLTVMITNTLLWLKLPGEEYTVIKNDLQSTILGKEEAYNISNLAIEDGEAGFKLPSLSDDVFKRIMGNTSEVGIEVSLFLV